MLRLKYAICWAVGVSLSADWASAQTIRGLNLFSGDAWPDTYQPGLTLPVCMQGSSPLWTVDGVSLEACPAPNPNDPARLAIYYGFPNIYPTDLTPIPFASWIWDAAQVADADGAENDEFAITKFFDLPSCPGGISAELRIAADDFAQVFVNGTLVDEVGSVIDPAKSERDRQQLKTVPIGAFLASGSTNVITIRAVNGPGSFTGCTDCSYAQNPAGVIFAAGIFCSP